MQRFSQGGFGLSGEMRMVVGAMIRAIIGGFAGVALSRVGDHGLAHAGANYALSKIVGAMGFLAMVLSRQGFSAADPP